MKQFILLVEVFGLFVGLNACKNSNDVSTKSDTRITQSSVIAFDSKQKHAFLSEPLHTGEGETMVYLYQQNPIKEFKTVDEKPLKAFEFDKTIIERIRKDSSIVGLRVYLAKEPKSSSGAGGLYTLVAVPYDKNGYNLKDVAFEWHNPCPPCSTPPNGHTEPNTTNTGPQDALSYGNLISTFYKSQTQVDSLRNANK